MAELSGGDAGGGIAVPLGSRNPSGRLSGESPRHGSTTDPDRTGGWTGNGGSLQFVGCGHVAVQDIQVRVDGGDAMQCEGCDFMLLRRLRLASVRSEGQDETLKLNQSRHCYIEDCEITDAGDNCIDVVGVQHGHIVRCRIGNASDWGAYLKGGSAHWIVADNEIFGCGTGGFTAGQGSGFQFMVPPYLHYEAYDVKVFNNLVRDCAGAGLGVNGGYNILFAHNTCWPSTVVAAVMAGRLDCVIRCGWRAVGERAVRKVSTSRTGTCGSTTTCS